jgi:hypothetical protein
VVKGDALTFEYVLSVALVALVVVLYALAFSTLNYFFSFIVAIFSSILGAFLIPFGFWGADFAFDAVRRGESHVYVPFLGRKHEEGTEKKPDSRGRNYTPLEWWNLNWLAVSLGIGFLILGLFVIGYSLGRIQAA